MVHLVTTSLFQINKENKKRNIYYTPYKRKEKKNSKGPEKKRIFFERKPIFPLFKGY